MSVRVATTADLSAMLEIYRPFVEKTFVSFEYEVPSLADFSRRFSEHTAQFPWLVWEESGQVLGYAYAGAPWERAAYRWCAESSIYLAPEARGRGVGRALYETLEFILKQQGYRILYAVIVAENQDSIRFHEAMGFTHCALFPNCGYKLGNWYGVAWLVKQLLPLESPQSFPKPWHSLEGTT